MKESYGKGLATRPGPESCASHGNTTGEALTRVHAGQPSSSEIIFSACRPCDVMGKATSRVTPIASRPWTPRSLRPCACVETLCTEIGRPWKFPHRKARDGPRRHFAARRTCTFPGSRTIS